MSLEFLSPAPDGGAVRGAPLASSPLEPSLAAAGANFEGRDGWRVAVDFGSVDAEAEACRHAAGIADRSAIGKLELQGGPAALDGATDGLGDAVVWRSSPDRALVLCEPGATVELRARLREACEGADCHLVELTAGYGAIELSGPLARDVLARLTSLDTRDEKLPVGEVRGGTVAEVPGALIRTEADAYLVLVSAPEAPDAWEMALDAGTPLGLRAIGEGARDRRATAPRREAARA